MIYQPRYPVSKGVHEFPFLSPEQCKHFAGRVMRAKAGWVDRGFFNTLGATTYQDDIADYPDIADAINPLMWEQFAPLYLDLYKFFSELMERKVCPHPMGVGYMGFHIFDARAGDNCGHPHVDEPFDRIDWPFEYAHPFTFTLPLELPAGGGGLDLWPDVTDKQMDSYVASGALPEHQHLPYSVGKLYLHDGLTPHRIANPCAIEDGEFRITLQGHGVVTAEGLVLYF